MATTDSRPVFAPGDHVIWRGSVWTVHLHKGGAVVLTANGRQVFAMPNECEEI